VIVGNERNDSAGGPAIKEIDGAASLDYVGAAKYEADWVLADSNGQANAAVFKLPNAPAHDDMVQMIQDRFAAFGASAKVSRVETVAVQDWGTRLPVLTRSILTSDPTVNYLIPLVDFPSQFIVPAVNEAGLAGKVKISTFNGTPAILHLLKDGNVVGADIGGANIWESWSYVDLALRVLTGMPSVREPIPLRVFDSTNIDSINIDADTGELWYDTQQAKDGFMKLWGLA
jgi:ribose transport system substrate-binding protein